ncbi:MAG: hypothetical protein HZB67_00875 [Candidatus Aenigmarchaeota archaeon]|nr:hypothetical protein [Candidatus Aenigmarchaeota archaeon]
MSEHQYLLFHPKGGPRGLTLDYDLIDAAMTSAGFEKTDYMISYNIDRPEYYNLTTKKELSQEQIKAIGDHAQVFKRLA